MRDDISIAGGQGVVGIRPQTAQTDYEPRKLQNNPSTSSFERIPIAPKTAASFLNKISTHRGTNRKSSNTNIHPMTEKSKNSSLERKKRAFENSPRSPNK